MLTSPRPGGHPAAPIGADAPAPPPPSRPWVKRLLPLMIILAVAAAVFATGLHRELSLEGLVQHRARLSAFVEAHFLLALATFLGIYIASVALSLPGASFLTIASGVLFGGIIGGLVAIVGATIGATIIFAIARTAVGEALVRRAGPLAAKLADGFRADAFNYLLFLRLVPLFPFWLVNLAPAVFGVKLAPFVTATALGIIPGTFAFAFFGAGLDSVLAAQETAYRACIEAGSAGCKLDFNVKAALTPKLLLALTALGLAALIPVLLKRWRARSEARSATT